MYKLCCFRHQTKHRSLKKNPLKNSAVMGRLNPYHKVMVKAAKDIEARRKKAKAEKLEAKRAGVSFISSNQLFL